MKAAQQRKHRPSFITCLQVCEEALRCSPGNIGLDFLLVNIQNVFLSLYLFSDQSLDLKSFKISDDILSVRIRMLNRCKSQLLDLLIRMNKGDGLARKRPMRALTQSFSALIGSHTNWVTVTPGFVGA